MTSKATCLSCRHCPLELLPESDAKITFYRCPTCHRHFAQLPGRSLTERWGGSLSLVLYGTIFSQKPQADARCIASMFRNRESREQLARIVADIRQELAYPSQLVRDVHGQSASEEDLRAFLTLVADLLTEEVKEDAVVQTLKGHASWVRCLAFRPDGQILASGSIDGSIKLWDPSRGHLLHTLTGHVGGVFALAWSPSGGLLVSGGQDSTIKLWDPQSGKLLRSLEGHGNAVRARALSTEGQTLVSASTDQTVRRWDLQTGRLLQPFIDHPRPLYSVAMSRNHQIIASGDEVGVIRLWHARTRKLLRILRGHSGKVLSLIMVNDRQLPISSTMLMSGSADRAMKWWGPTTGDSFPLSRVTLGAVRSVAFHPAWQTVISSSEDKTIKEWNLYGAQETIRTLPGHAGPVYSLAISPDSRFIASGSLSIKIWGKKR